MATKYDISIIEQSNKRIRFCIKGGEDFLSFNEVFNSWEDKPEFIRFYVSQLIKFEFEAFRWEHPALNEKYLNKRYECVLQKSMQLDLKPIDYDVFKDYIYSNGNVMSFCNLGKNAKLIVPTKKTNDEIYNHFGKFIRFADEKQIFAIFNKIGKIVRQEIRSKKTIWLSTAGLGVIWLHIRMDTKPKYYKTKEYKELNLLDTI